MIPDCIKNMDGDEIYLLGLWIGGSHLYELNNDKSDIDYRFVYVPRHRERLLGLQVGSSETIDIKDGDRDIVGYELRHFMRIMKKQNTGALELIFSEPIYKHETLAQLLAYRNHFLDSDKLFNSLKSYIYGERRLAVGERTGLLGCKRKEALDTYGFSPKNFVQLLRLTLVGSYLFECGQYHVKASFFSKEERELLLDIKNNPERFNKDELISISEKYEARLNKSYDNLTRKLEFDGDLANRICFQIYRYFVDEGELNHPKQKIEVNYHEKLSQNI